MQSAATQSVTEPFQLDFQFPPRDFQVPDQWSLRSSVDPRSWMHSFATLRQRDAEFSAGERLRSCMNLYFSQNQLK